MVTLSGTGIDFKKTLKLKKKKQDLDFGIPDPYPKDGTGRFAHVDNTQMFGKMCYLNTLHKCLTRCIFWIPYINVWQDVLSEYLTSMFGKMCHLNTLEYSRILCVIMTYSGISYNNPTYFRIFCVIIGYSRISYNNTKYSEKCWVIIGYFDFSQCHALCLIKVFRWHILPNIDVRYSENASCQTFM